MTKKCLTKEICSDFKNNKCANDLPLCKYDDGQTTIPRVELAMLRKVFATSDDESWREHVAAIDQLKQWYKDGE